MGCTMGAMRGLFAISLLLAGTVLVSARDRLDADWGTDCGPDLQCWIEIRPTPANGAYSIRYVAADRRDASAVRCEAKGSVRVTGDVDRFTGTLSGRKIRIRRTDDAEIVVSGGGTLCGPSFKANGRYDPIGD